MANFLQELELARIKRKRQKELQAKRSQLTAKEALRQDINSLQRRNEAVRLKNKLGSR